MTDQELMNKIRHLANKMSQEELLEMELSGFQYRHDPLRTDIWKKTSRHIAIPKKKYVYVDQQINGDLGGSGKFMVENQGANKGTVWSIKAYGQKGYPRGNVDEQIKISEHNITQLTKAIEEKATKGNFGLTLNQGNRKVVWVG